jgi:hypothetical protein
MKGQPNATLVLLCAFGGYAMSTTDETERRTKILYGGACLRLGKLPDARRAFAEAGHMPGTCRLWGHAAGDALEVIPVRFQGSGAVSSNLHAEWGKALIASGVLLGQNPSTT